MINLKKEIKALLKEQKFIIPRLKVIDKTLKKLENSIERYISREWKKIKPKVELKTLVSGGGSHCVGFKMKAWIEIEGYELCGRKWMKVEYDFSGREVETSYIPVDPPVEMKFLKAFAERMTKELGMRIIVYQPRLPTKKQLKKQVEADGFIDFEGANAYFDDDLEFVKEGKIWYKGWDINDNFLICRRKSNGKLVIAYSTSGHGGGFDTTLDDPTKKELKAFLEHIEQDSDNLGVRKLL